MKKLILSITTIFTFVIYSFIIQNESSVAQNNSGTTGSNNAGNSSNPTPTSGINGGTSDNSLGGTGTGGSSSSGTTYKDGEYTGDTSDAFYGNIQVKAIIQNGKITDVQFMQYPNDRRTSIEINTQAMPALKSEAIQTQNANVDIVSGATDTSQAFIQSLGSALSQASK